MGTTTDHRRYAQECVAKAECAEDENDKALWLTLAHSWVRLAEDVARSSSHLDCDADETPERVSADED